MGLAPGTRVGGYEVVSLVGVGGMGEVYRARDTRLGRDVALKSLPAAFANDAERVARFTREAKVLASLDHPHIAHIYGVEETAEARVLVLEFVEGGTLAARLTRGALPVDEAVAIARQVADALSAAHDKGIVHRDLKPGNIALTPAGEVKVLDFGLAKAIDPDGRPPSDLTAAPTITTPAMTQAGLILGTAAYMAPEQAKGREAGKRSDIWAFGCVLYEMLTGSRPFAGEDVSDTLAAVLMKEPDWDALPPTVPVSIRALLQRSLVKDARKRLPDISVAQYLLEERSTDAAPVMAPAPRLARRERALWAGALAGVVVLAVAAVRLSSPSPVAPDTTRFTVSPPSGRSLGSGVGANIAISPDGKYAVFTIDSGAGGAITLALRALDDDTVRELPGTTGAALPFWAPDSRSIAFFASNLSQLRRTDRDGGPVQTIADVPGAQGGTWAPDGTIVVGASVGPLRRVSATGGTVSEVTVLDPSLKETSHRHPVMLPDGQHFLYFTARVDPGGSIFVGSLDDASKTLVVSDSDSHAQYADGYVLFARENTLLAQPFEPDSLGVSGDPVAVAQNIWINPTVARAGFSVSNTGTLTFRIGVPSAPTQLTWLDRSGRELGKVGEPNDQTSLELSPDGARAVVSIFDPARQTRDIWIQDLTRNVRTRLTFGAGEEFQAVWSPDSARVAFSSLRADVLDLYVKAADGSGAEDLLLTSNDNKYPTSWSPDGRTLLFNIGNARSRTGNDILTIPLEPQGPREPQVLISTQFNEQTARLSPDSRWLAYMSNESGRAEIYVAPYPGPGGKWQISTGGGGTVRWHPNGRELFYLTPGNTSLMSVPVDGSGAAFRAGTAVKLFDARFRNQNYRGYGVGNSYDISPDGTRILANLLTNAEAAPDVLTVVTNWTSLLRR
jgi:Tol biopolymer transport system component